MTELIQAFERHMNLIEKWNKEISEKLEWQNKALVEIDTRLGKIMEGGK